MTPRKPKAWAPPVGMKVTVSIERGGATFSADASPADALPVARLLTVMARTLTAESPDLLHQETSVGGSVLPYDWAEEYEQGRKQQRPPSVGF